MRRVGASVRARLTAVARRRLARRRVALRCAPPVASFTFDDVPLSAYATGAHLLESHGAHGTFYVAGGLVGARGRDEPMLGAEEIRDLAARGHEIGCHTHDHAKPAGRTAPEFEADLARNARALGVVLPGTTLSSFAYPFGEVTLGLKRAAGARFGTCRTICRGVNAGGADAAFLLANALYGMSPDPGRIDRLLASTVARSGWVIFYTHDVRAKPSRYGCTPEHLDAVIRRVCAAGVEILPVGAALEHATRG